MIDKAVWNQWRANYDQMSLIDQKQFYQSLNGIPQLFGQEIVPVIKRFLYKNEPNVILELGGCDGELAQTILTWGQKSMIPLWHNFDFIEYQVERDYRYQFRDITKDRNIFSISPPAMGLESSPYFPNQTKYNIFIASHVLEHLKMKDVDRILGTLPYNLRMIAEVPLPIEKDPDWTDYEGTHIFEGNKFKFITLCHLHKFELMYLENDCMVFQRGKVYE